MTVLQRERTDGSENTEVCSKALLQPAITRAFALLDEGRRQEAIGQVKPYAAHAAQSSAGCYLFGLIHFNAGELHEALLWFDRAAALQPDFAEALSGRAITLQQLGQPQDALEALKAASKLRPHDAEIFFSIGAILQSLGRMTDALSAYEEALRCNSGHCEALTNRGALLDRFGRLDEALGCFDAIAKLKPRDSTNLFNRASVLQKLGRHEEALAAYEEAARIGPPDADNELNRGNVLQRLGRAEEALAAYDLALRYRPSYPQALYNKGMALQALGRLEQALSAYDAALALDPGFYEASCNRGNVLHELGRCQDALAACSYTLRIRPGFLPALINRATISLQLGQAEDALAACDEALRREPGDPQCLAIRGAALYKLGRLGEALASLDAALAQKPAAAEAWLNRGNVLQEFDRHPEAIASYRQALRLKPHYPEALSGLGVALKEMGEIDLALGCFNEALEYKRHYPDARNNRAGALLIQGRLGEGFADFESRWGRSNAPPKTLVSDLPQWQGQDLQGQRILVWDEQGLGDLIQFSRYLLLLVERGAELTFLCRKNMHRLLQTLPVPVHLIESFDGAERFSFQCALMSLPLGFGTSLETIPAPVPYLRPEPELVAKWADRIGSNGFRIGIAWQGNKFINLQRSVPLASFAPLASVEGVRLISLMKDQSPAGGSAAAGSFAIESLGQDFDAGPDSFIDCAAAMETLDLIVTSDTSIAHLAGALGRPAFVALKKVPDWRWLLEREDCPWYPAMRLFRQTGRGEWGPVFEKIALQVRALAQEKREAARHRAKCSLAIPGSAGELIDKISILEIKESHVADEAKLANIRHELSLLRQLKAQSGLAGAKLAELEAGLKAINRALFQIEDELRAHEARGDFGERFISLAREVYTSNDKRAELKKEINLLCGSAIVEEKFYPAAAGLAGGGLDLARLPAKMPGVKLLSA